MRLADKLKQQRKQKGWTQAVAARNIDIQQSYLSKLENGRYVPSNEVIKKLCNAYDLSVDEFITTSSNQPYYIKQCIIIIAIGLILIINGYFGLVFPQTYYTYQTSPIDKQQTSKLNLNYHLSDQYHGKRYVQSFSNIKYEYVLIAQHNILRKENRWLISIGLILVIGSMGYLFVSWKFKK